MNRNTNPYKKLAILGLSVLLSALLSGCGAHKAPTEGGSSDLSSRSNPDDSDGSSGNGSIKDGLLAECNFAKEKSVGFEAYLGSYY